MIVNKIPDIDMNTLYGDNLTELNKLLKISRTVEQMAPAKRGTPMIDWMLEQLQFFKMFNSRLVHQKNMVKSNYLRNKNEQFVFCDPISRSMQYQLEAFFDAINTYYADRMEKNNILIELNCAFQKTDIFEPFQIEYKSTVDDSGHVEPLATPKTIEHQEGDIISIIFVDARRGHGNEKIKPEIHLDYVQQYMVGVFLSEDASDNSIEGALPGLVGLRALRKPNNGIFMKKLG